MSYDRIILTADEAISLLPEGEYVHNTTGGMIMIGCDYSRESAEKALRGAVQIEIGGPMCKAMRHPLVTWDSPKHCTFFEADMDKVEAFEAARLASTEAAAS
jgi:hypothetical protein